MQEYALSEWEPVDEQYYKYDDKQEVDFAEGVFGEQSICEGNSSQPVNSEGNSSQLERFTDRNQASIQDLEHQFGSLEDAETYVSEIYSAASRSFDEARKLVNQVTQARGYFPVVGVGIYHDGLSSLPGNRTPVARGRTPRGN